MFCPVKKSYPVLNDNSVMLAKVCCKCKWTVPVELMSTDVTPEQSYKYKTLTEYLRYTLRKCVCTPILVTTFPEWLSGTEPLPHTPGAVRPSSLCL